MVKARVVDEDNRTFSGNGYNGFFYTSSSRWKGIHFGLMVFLIGVVFLLQDLGYIASKISFWTYVFLIFGSWLILRRLF